MLLPSSGAHANDKFCIKRPEGINRVDNKNLRILKYRHSKSHHRQSQQMLIEWSFLVQPLLCIQVGVVVQRSREDKLRSIEHRTLPRQCHVEQKQTPVKGRQAGGEVMRPGILL